MCTAVNIDLFRFLLISRFFGRYNFLLHKFATSVFRFRFCDAKLYGAILQHEKDFMHTYIQKYYIIYVYTFKKTFPSLAQKYTNIVRYLESKRSK